jgi:hypothetical protein
MQTARQFRFNHREEAAREKGSRKTDVRASTIRAMHATWRKICDLEGEELRDARLQFATRALNLRKPLKSTGKLSPAQLGIVLDAMRRLERSPALPGVVDSRFALNADRMSALPAEGEVIHLATDAQVAAIEKLRVYLNWSAIGTQAFINNKFRRASARFLTPAQANSCTMIMLTIAARKRIKDRGTAGKISRVMIRSEIPALKRELNIDQKPFTIEDTENDD